MVIRSAWWILGCGLLGSGVASHVAAQAGYPQPAPQQPYAQPAPVQPQPVYQQPAPQPQPAYPQPAPSPVPAAQPYGQPAPQPAPFGAQPQPAPAAGYPTASAQYPNFPVPPPDNTQPPPGGVPDGAFQLGLFTTLVRYEPLAIEAENNGGKVDISNLVWGIANNPIGIELGYGLSDMIVFGGVVSIGGSSDSQKPDGGTESSTSSFALELGPKIDLMFSPGSKVMPFIGAEVLLHTDSQSADGGFEASNLSFIFEARGGLRAILTDSFSLDPALFFGGGFGTGSQNNGGGAADQDYSISGFRVGLSIGLSGWMI
jgi:hypothetical protein